METKQGKWDEGSSLTTELSPIEVVFLEVDEIEIFPVPTPDEYEAIENGTHFSLFKETVKGAIEDLEHD